LLLSPLKIAGVTTVPGPYENNYPDLASTPISLCPKPPLGQPTPCVPISFWEPARINETVKDPFCFPGVGLSLPLSGGLLGGGGSEQSSNSSSSNNTDTSSFAQAHHWVFLPWALLELLTDFICLEHSGFDVGYLTEVDPLWQNDIMNFFIQPEALLFANPIARSSCIADAVGANAGMTLSPLLWCVGSGGSAYPLTGHVNNDDLMQANESISARMIYKLSRELLICDPAVWPCACIHTPIWIKHNWRTHIVKPVRDIWCHPFGRSDLLWDYGKNPPVIGDNFAWIIFRKRACCMF